MKYLLLIVLLLVPVESFGWWLISEQVVAESGATEYTIGNTQSGSTGNYGTDTTWYWNHGQVDSTGGTFTKLCIELDSVGASAGVKLSLYGPTDSNGDPDGHTLIAQGEIVTASVGENCISISEVASADSYYAIGYALESSDTLIPYNDDVYIGWRQPTVIYGDAFPVELTTTTINDYYWHLWIVYEH